MAKASSTTISDTAKRTVTLLFTDIEGSTRLWAAQPDEMRVALAWHDELLRGAIEGHGGEVFKTIGDAFCAAFDTPSAAVAAAATAQGSLSEKDWGNLGEVRVRMALHPGEVEHRDGDYFGPPLNRVARLLSAGHGGQVLLTQAAVELMEGGLPHEMALRDLGEHRLRDLSSPTRVYQLVAPALPADFPPLRTVDAFPNNLSLQLSSFVGREAEMAAVAHALERGRLITITGPGGSGKTRLALQVAADGLERFPDGVWFVDLAPIEDAALVAPTTAAVLNVREVPGRNIVEGLTEGLAGRELLIVLDNCEHVLDAAARLAEALLRACPGVRVLATSREPLDIAGETVLPIPTLALPERGMRFEASETAIARLTEYDAVRLFIERAVAARSDFAVTNENAPAVAEVCWRLDGIPLAIELAAARVRALSPDQIAVRLEDRFRLLTGGSRTALPRHQTLQAAIAWSHDLLTEPERVLFRRLAIFRGGWTLEAAEAVCAGPDLEDWEVVDNLLHLVDRSLVESEQRPRGQRFRMLESFRDYAGAQLEASGDREALRQRHARFFVDLAATSDAELLDVDDVADELVDEFDNFRAAMRWAIESAETEVGLRLAKAIFGGFRSRGHIDEARRWIEDMLPGANGVPGHLLGDAHSALGTIHFSQGDYLRALQHHERALGHYRSAGHTRAEALTLANICHNHMTLGTHDTAAELAAASVRIARKAADPQLLARCLTMLGTMHRDRAEPEQARGAYEEGVAIARQAGAAAQVRWNTANLGEVAADIGDAATARTYLREALDMALKADDRWFQVFCLTCLGKAEVVGGDPTAAVEAFRRALTIAQRLQSTYYVANAIEGLARAEASLGRPERGATLLGAAAALRDEIHEPPPPADAGPLDRAHEALRADLGPTAFDTAWQAGRAMSRRDALAYAISEQADA